MSVLDSTRQHTDAVIAKLVGADIRTGDGVGKKADGAGIKPPYAVVYPLAGELVGTLDDPQCDGELVWQVTYVGASREQVEGLRDKGRAALVAGFDVEGRTIVLVIVDTVGNVERDDDVKPQLFYCPERYRAWSTAGPEGS